MRFEIWIYGQYFRSWMTRTLADQDKADLLAGWKARGVEVPGIVEIKEKDENVLDKLYPDNPIGAGGIGGPAGIPAGDGKMTR